MHGYSERANQSGCLKHPGHKCAYILIFVNITSFINALKLGIFTHPPLAVASLIYSLPGAWLPFLTGGLYFYYYYFFNQCLNFFSNNY